MEVLELRAEIERLRQLVDAREADLGRMHGETSAEIAGLRIECRGWYDHNTGLIQQRDKVWAENRELRAEIERLRSEFKDIHGYADCPIWICERIEAALKDTKT